MLTCGGPIVIALVVANFVSIRLLGDLATHWIHLDQEFVFGDGSWKICPYFVFVSSMLKLGTHREHAFELDISWLFFLWFSINFMVNFGLCFLILLFVLCCSFLFQCPWKYLGFPLFLFWWCSLLLFQAPYLGKYSSIAFHSFDLIPRLGLVLLSYHILVPCNILDPLSTFQGMGYHSFLFF